MLKIGITGGIGSGKTTVCNFFEVLNIPVFYADDVAKSIMNTNSKLVTALKAEFGNTIYSNEGVLNRKELAAIVFNNLKALKKLNSLVHPAAIQAFIDWSNTKNSVYVIKEAAILFESGSYKDCDFTVLVHTPESLRIKRVMQRDGVTEQQVRARINKQMPEEEKLKLADFIIVNDGVEGLIPQALKLHEYFLNYSTAQH